MITAKVRNPKKKVQKQHKKHFPAQFGCGAAIVGCGAAGCAP
jgi:hypothetical protein